MMLIKIIKAIKNRIYNDLGLRRKCILLAAREQGLSELSDRLGKIVDDEKIKYQYPYVGYAAFNHPYYVTKIRTQQAFQISLVLHAVKLLQLAGKKLTIVDIGDSAGTHLLYLRELLGEIRSLSVNLDNQSVELIRKRGLEALCCRAEELEKYDVQADLFMSFQMVEHLVDPIHLLKNLADHASGEHLVITVPYLATSRVALTYIRQGMKEKRQAGHVHVFELSPEDWKLVFRFAGWETVYERIYYQYPRKWWGRWLRHCWRTTDFEGFFGVVLKKNPEWSRLYADW